ncbi:MAG: ABC transporter ATP-binding protein [Janthinobacterium lividum]
MSNSREVWQRLWSYIKPDQRYLWGALIAAQVAGALDLTVATLLKPFLDTTAASTHQSVTTHEVAILYRVSVSLVALYAIRAGFNYADTVWFAEAGQRLGMRLREDIYRHLQGLSLSFFNQQRTGALMSTINNDVPLLQGVLAGLKDVASAPLIVIGGVIAIFLIDWKLSLAALIVVPLMAMTIGRLTRLIRGMTTHTQDKLADVNTIMEETLSGIRVIQSFSAEQQEISRFSAENREAKNRAMSVTRQGAKIKPATDLLGAIGIALALWIAGHEVITHALTMGQLGSFIFLLNKIATGVSSLGNVKVIWEQMQAGAGRIFDRVLNVESEIQDAPDAITLGEVSGKVEFEHVAFAYNVTTPVLRDISFTMNPGEVVAVVGLSGAGKSTLADLIPRFYDPQAGTIRVDGHDIREVTLASLRHQIGIVPQETVLFGGTIRDNIAYGNPLATDTMIEAASRAANAHSFISDPTVMPDGYQTVVGERGKQLSGGQRQRVSIARALLKDPRILILDEATSSLDAESEKVVQEALETLMHGRTTLVIAHRLSTIRNAHKIMVMQSGEIVETGSHDALMHLPDGLYRHLYERFHEKKYPWEKPGEEDQEGEDRLGPSLISAVLP